MWTIIVLATSIVTALGNMVPYQYPYSYPQPQDYMSGPTYGDWSAPTKSFQHQLLDTFSSICPGCLKGDGVDEVTGISGLKDANEYSYYRTYSNPAVIEMIDKLGINTMAKYYLVAKECLMNLHVVKSLPEGNLFKMFCSHIIQVVQQGYF